MEIKEAINNLRNIQNSLTNLKRTHPLAAIKAGVRKECFHFAAYESAHRGTVTIEQIETNVQRMIPDLEELRTTHPGANVLPKVHKKEFSFMAILGSSYTGCAGTIRAVGKITHHVRTARNSRGYDSLFSALKS
jgi:hypothetical protein